MSKPRRKIDAALQAKIAFEALREREIEQLHAKIGQLTVESSFLARRSGR